MADYDWSETAQAKWDVRRMLENLGNDIQCSVFSIVDLQYKGDGPIRKKNPKGLLESDAENRVIRPKLAYYAVQNVAAVFNNTMERLPDTRLVRTISGEDLGGYQVSTDRSVAVYGYRNQKTGGDLYTIWKDEAIPMDQDPVDQWDFVFAGSHFKNPVWIDILTGRVYQIPMNRWKRKEGLDCFENIPVYDGPVLLADQSAVAYKPE